MSETATNLGELSALARRLGTEYAVSRILAEEGGASDCLRRALAVMGDELQWEYCVCWRLVLEGAAAGTAMKVLATWQRNPHLSAPLDALARGLEVTAAQGVAGRAWRLGAPLWFEDIAADDDFLLAEAARQAQLGAGVCCPISFRGRVIGLLEFMAARGVSPDPESLPVLVSLAEQVGQYLDREAMATALKSSESRYRKLFDANIAGVHCSTLGGVPMEVNPAFVRMLGFPSVAAALAYDTVKLYADPADRTALLEQLQRHGADANRQLRLRRPDGSIIWVLANTVLIPGSDGVPDMNESTVIDITEAKEMERRQWQASKMEGIGRLAGGVAHDFNNLLTIINGYSDLLLGRMEENDAARASIEKIKQAGLRAEGLTRQLLAFSRQQALETAVLDLEAIVAETESMLGDMLGSRIRVRRCAEPGLGRVRADAGQIGQIVMNLAINARDAMPQGGELLIEMNNVEIDAEYLRGHVQARTGRYVRLAVSDTGCGMDHATKQHVFEPFFTTKPRGKGTGLGLATVYGLTLQSGGWVELYSEVGRGTTFKVYLPRVQEQSAPAAPAPAVPQLRSEGRGEAVLIVEDEIGVRSLIEEVLGAHGYRVRSAESAEQAAAAAEGLDDLALIVTDIVLPGRNGREFAQDMKRAHPQAQVLLMSGYTERAAAMHGLVPAGSGFGYLQKPFTPMRLLESVSQALAGTRGRGTEPGAVIQ
ncbi:MAG TPA: ATP-binding protein [Terriglobales bacterium]|nr:ATP-binding protein [Terriglobales bacterium]